MNDGAEAKGTTEKKKVKGWSAKEMKDKVNSPVETDTRNVKLEETESEGDRPTLERLGRKSGGRGSGQDQREALEEGAQKKRSTQKKW